MEQKEAQTLSFLYKDEMILERKKGSRFYAGDTFFLERIFQYGQAYLLKIPLNLQ